MIRTLSWMMLGVTVLFVVTLIGLADAGRGQSLFLWAAHLPAGDKCGHFILFGGMAFLANVALNGNRFQIGRFTILKGSLFVFVPTFLEECSQLLVRTRSFDLLDLLADGIGILLAGWLATLVLRQVRGGRPTADSRDVSAV